MLLGACWKLLGIGPTKDAGAIMRAYSQAIKSCHPEEDPEGWTRLHEAYKTALAYAEGTQRTTGADDLRDAAFIREAAEKPPREPEAEVEAQYAEDFDLALKAADQSPEADALEARLQEIWDSKRSLSAREAGEVVEALHPDLPWPRREQELRMVGQLLRLIHANAFTEKALPILLGAAETISYQTGDWKVRENAASEVKHLKTLQDSTPGFRGVGRIMVPLMWIAALVGGIIMYRETMITLQGPLLAMLLLPLFSWVLINGNNEEVSGLGGHKWVPFRYEHRGYLPPEPQRRRWLPVLLGVLAAVSAVGVLWSLQAGVARIYRQETVTYTPYSPDLEPGAVAEVQLTGAPEFLGIRANVKEDHSRVNGIYTRIYKYDTRYYLFLATGQEGEFLLEVSDRDLDRLKDAQEESAQPVLRGKAMEMDLLGSLVLSEDVPAEDAFLYYDIFLEEEIQELGDRIGGSCVLRYDPFAKDTRNVDTGTYEPGRNPCILFLFFLLGSLSHLAILGWRALIRSSDRTEFRELAQRRYENDAKKTDTPETGENTH